MRFYHDKIVHDENYFRILGVELAESEISYNNLMLKVRRRIEKLTYRSVQTIMKDGKTEQEAVADVWAYIKSFIVIYTNVTPQTEEELCEAIINSPQFFDFKLSVWQSFKDIHRGVIKKDTPVPVMPLTGEIPNWLVEDMNEQDQLSYIIESISNINTITP